MKLKAKKVKSRTQLVKELDTQFSRFIRNRDAQNGLCKCVTCGLINEVKKMQCGHFISRKCYSTRWNEKNCNVQCYGCNVMQSGRQFEHSIYIDNKYGKGTSLNLLIESKQIVKITKNELIERIKHYEKINDNWQA